MSSSWPPACLPDGTVPGGHSELVLLPFFFFFLPPFVYVCIKIQVVSGITEVLFFAIRQREFFSPLNITETWSRVLHLLGFLFHFLFTL